MSGGLPEGWEWDYDGKRWFYRYKPTGLTQYHFPQPGDEFPNFVDAAAPAPELAPEEKLESYQQMKRRNTTGDDSERAERRATRASMMRATGGPLTSPSFEDDDDDKGFYFQPESFMYLGPGSYNDVSPLDGEDDNMGAGKEETLKKGEGKGKGKEDEAKSKGKEREGDGIKSRVSPLASENTTPMFINSEPVTSASELRSEPAVGEPILSIDTKDLGATKKDGGNAVQSPGVPMLDSRERPFELAETTAPPRPPWDPVGIMAEMATEFTSSARIETHPDPIEMPDNYILAPIETPTVQHGNSFIAELPGHRSPVREKAPEPQQVPYQGLIAQSVDRSKTPMPQATVQAQVVDRSTTPAGQAPIQHFQPLMPGALKYDAPVRQQTPVSSAYVQAQRSSTPQPPKDESPAVKPFAITRKPSKYRAYVPGVATEDSSHNRSSLVIVDDSAAETKKDEQPVPSSHRASLYREESLMFRAGPKIPPKMDMTNIPSVLQPPQLPPKGPAAEGSPVPAVLQPAQFGNKNSPAERQREPSAPAHTSQPAMPNSLLPSQSNPAQGLASPIPSVLQPARGHTPAPKQEFQAFRPAQQQEQPQQNFLPFNPNASSAAGTEPPRANTAAPQGQQFYALPQPGQVPHSLTPTPGQQVSMSSHPGIQRVSTAPDQKEEGGFGIYMPPARPMKRPAEGPDRTDPASFSRPVDGMNTVRPGDMGMPTSSSETNFGPTVNMMRGGARPYELARQEDTAQRPNSAGERRPSPRLNQGDILQAPREPAALPPQARQEKVEREEYPGVGASFATRAANQGRPNPQMNFQGPSFGVQGHDTSMQSQGSSALVPGVRPYQQQQGNMLLSQQPKTSRDNTASPTPAQQPMSGGQPTRLQNARPVSMMSIGTSPPSQPTDLPSPVQTIASLQRTPPHSPEQGTAAKQSPPHRQHQQQQQPQQYQHQQRQPNQEQRPQREDQYQSQQQQQQGPSYGKHHYQAPAPGKVHMPTNKPSFRPEDISPPEPRSGSQSSGFPTQTPSPLEIRRPSSNASGFFSNGTFVATPGSEESFGLGQGGSFSAATPGSRHSSGSAPSSAGAASPLPGQMGPTQTEAPPKPGKVPLHQQMMHQQMAQQQVAQQHMAQQHMAQQQMAQQQIMSNGRQTPPASDPKQGQAQGQQSFFPSQGGRGAPSGLQEQVGRGGPQTGFQGQGGRGTPPGTFDTTAGRGGQPAGFQAQGGRGMAPAGFPGPGEPTAQRQQQPGTGGYPNDMSEWRRSLPPDQMMQLMQEQGPRASSPRQDQGPNRLQKNRRLSDPSSMQGDPPNQYRSDQPPPGQKGGQYQDPRVQQRPMMGPDGRQGPPGQQPQSGQPGGSYQGPSPQGEQRVMAQDPQQNQQARQQNQMTNMAMQAMPIQTAGHILHVIQEHPETDGQPPPSASSYSTQESRRSSQTSSIRRMSGQFSQPTSAGPGSQSPVSGPAGQFNPQMGPQPGSNQPVPPPSMQGQQQQGLPSQMAGRPGQPHIIKLGGAPTANQPPSPQTGKEKEKNWMSRMFKPSKKGGAQPQPSPMQVVPPIQKPGQQIPPGQFPSQNMPLQQRPQAQVPPQMVQPGGPQMQGQQGNSQMMRPGGPQMQSDMTVLPPGHPQNAQWGRGSQQAQPPNASQQPQNNPMHNAQFAHGRTQPQGGPMGPGNPGGPMMGNAPPQQFGPPQHANMAPSPSIAQSSALSVSAMNAGGAQAQNANAMKTQLANMSAGGLDPRQGGGINMGVSPAGPNQGPPAHLINNASFGPQGQPNPSMSQAFGQAGQVHPAAHPGQAAPNVSDRIRTSAYGAPMQSVVGFGQGQPPISQITMQNQAQPAFAQHAGKSQNTPGPGQSQPGVYQQLQGPPKLGTHYSPVGRNPYSPGQDSSPSNSNPYSPSQNSVGASPMNTECVVAPLFSAAPPTQAARGAAVSRSGSGRGGGSRPAPHALKNQVSEIGAIDSADDDDADMAATVVSADDVSVLDDAPSPKKADDRWAKKADYSGNDWGDEDEWGY
jgi:hypothetical protein